MTGLRLVCFDLGGVIVRICRSWEEGCAAANVPLRPTTLTPGVHDLHTRYQRGELPCAAYIEALRSALDDVYDAQELQAIHDAWILGEYADLIPMIDALHDRGLTTAALSNTNAGHWRQLPAYPAFMRLQHRLASHELGLVKPDPAIYRRLETDLDVPSEAILFFDDLPENVEAARTAGWNAELVDPHRETAGQMVEVLERYGVLEEGD